MKLYDPLGICAPVIFKAKCILQELWKVPNLHWDDELPSSIQQKWNEFRNQIPEEIKVPRCIQDQSSVWFELHGFGDASELGYGCCLYIRAITNDKRKTVRLLRAKLRVAPLKKATIPRLELLATLLLAELKEKAILAMKIQFQKITLWTDSKITLYRIKSTPSRFATFVANRIVRIQELTSPSQWKHIPGELNPADIVSRGCSPETLKSCNMWFNGPEFLQTEESNWPLSVSQENKFGAIADPELKPQSNSVICVAISQNSWAHHYSSLNRLLRVTSWITRFINNCKGSSASKTRGPLQALELSNALKVLVRQAQEEDFRTEINQLRTNAEFLNKSQLAHLRPFLDDSNILRVNGRLLNAEISENQRHPMLLSAKKSTDDNATNFAGADRSLKELRSLFQDEQHQATLQSVCADEGITWHTIPPNSPHFGGLWEAAVKAAKHHLKRTLGSTSFTTEELMTVTTQAEACLNSRPITPMSADPADLEALTPGHFLIGAPLNALPEPSLLDVNLNRLSRWQLLQQQLQMFWKRWSREYLSELQTRAKWKQKQNNLQIREMVLLKDDQLPPLKWSLGRIIETHAGADGLVRVVSVKTARGTYKRSIAKICPLPIN
ncbi:uncharacterized protein [Temnothorax nylanderi]|uniref:uncharacterized protein n=1 Tax=Temnothorax nylanderi TaxID=102681 RepID=UPI003A8B9542